MTTITALDQMRTLFQTKGFATRTSINEQKQWVLEVIRKEIVRTTMLFDYKTEEMLTII